VESDLEPILKRLWSYVPVPCHSFSHLNWECFILAWQAIQHSVDIAWESSGNWASVSTPWNHACNFAGSSIWTRRGMDTPQFYREAWNIQCSEHSSPTYVAWLGVCCWFSFLLQGFFSWFLHFSSLHNNFKIQSGTRGPQTIWESCTKMLPLFTKLISFLFPCCSMHSGPRLLR